MCSLSLLPSASPSQIRSRFFRGEIQALPQSDSNLADYLPLLFRINSAFLSNKFQNPLCTLTYTFAFNVSSSLYLLFLTLPSSPPRNPNHTSRTTPINTFFIPNLLGWNCAYFLCAPVSSTPLPTYSASYTMVL